MPSKARSRPVADGERQPPRPAASNGQPECTAGLRKASYDVEPDFGENLCGFEQRQAHYTRVAALEAADKGRGASLDRVGPGLVERLAGRNVALDLVASDGAEAHTRHRHPEHDLRVPADRHGGYDVVRAPRQSLQHRGGIGCVVGLAQHDAVDDDFGIRREHRLRRQLAAAHTMPSDGGLGARDALDVFEWSFVLARDLDDIAPAPRGLAQQQLLEFDADLPKQLLPARAFRSQIDRRTLGQHEERAHSRWYGCPDSMLVARYSCSASTTRASPCGNVSAESASTASAWRLTAGSSPSALPMTNATASARSRQAVSFAANSPVVQAWPRS